ncbi:phage antirepressor KilAC domain-containing protein [uncultured Clostridium sp.]|uniref:phage antirepressor KilAC domain-containing protein n=1 Tax=uncultured Clostridium sp. TaxID=59620 RepID=UPI00258EB303|nr:phage antirepressor KilAC domain-containing protein [uncultured Clostridium sp.]
MENNLMVFEGNNVEVFEFEGKVLFNPYHVGECLNISHEGVRKAITRMSNKQVIKLKNSNVTNCHFRKLHNTGENFLTESGVYKLIFKSHKEEAEKFQDWVTDEVLPTIRKNGMYATDELLDNPDLLIAAATKLKEEREKNRILNEINEKQTQIIGELQPRADYTDKILKNTGLVTISQIAKDYGMSGQALNKMLHELKVQYKQSQQWLLYRNYQDKGYTFSDTKEITRSDGRLDIKMTTKWTQKGRLFIYELLKTQGVLPTIELS